MKPRKAPVIDGFPTMFHLKFWHIVGNDVIFFYLDVMNKGTNNLNATNIILILETLNPSKMVNFRPIRLCKGFI